MNPYVSVIIPVHNSEKYLCRCLDSILAQSYHDFELILVDDGSTDNSWDICRTYARKDDRIRTIRQSVNKGVSAARNAGLETADGKWIYFCDSDDYLNSDSLKLLVNCTYDKVDLVLASYVRVCDDEKTLYQFQSSEYIDRIQAVKDFFEHGKTKLQSFLWNRLFRNEIIRDSAIRFNESIVYKEDGLFIVQYMCRMTQGAFHTSEVVYNYIAHSESAMGMLSKGIPPDFYTWLDARIIILDEIRKYIGRHEVVSKAKEDIFKFEFWVYAMMKSCGKIEYRTLFNLIAKTNKAVGPLNYLYFLLRRMWQSVLMHIKN